MDRTGKFVWFFVGVSVGAGVALLYAPKTGRDTRRLLGKKARHSREAMTEAGRDLLDKGRELYAKGRKAADDAVELLERGRRLVDS